MKINKDKRKVLHLGRTPCRLGTDWPGSSSAEKDMSPSVDHELCEPAVCSGSKKVNKNLNYINESMAGRPREAIVLLYLVFIRPHVEYCGQFAPAISHHPSQRQGK